MMIWSCIVWETQGNIFIQEQAEVRLLHPKQNVQVHSSGIMLFRVFFKHNMHLHAIFVCEMQGDTFSVITPYFE